MADTVRVKPWPGLILAGIPPAGADISRELAETWIDNHLVIAVKPTAPTVARPDIKAPANRQKRRRTR